MGVQSRPPSLNPSIQYIVVIARGFQGLHDAGMRQSLGQLFSKLNFRGRYPEHWEKFSQIYDTFRRQLVAYPSKLTHSSRYLDEDNSRYHRQNSCWNASIYWDHNDSFKRDVYFAGFFVNFSPSVMTCWAKLTRSNDSLWRIPVNWHILASILTSITRVIFVKIPVELCQFTRIPLTGLNAWFISLNFSLPSAIPASILRGLARVLRVECHYF